jgi:uncharacterized membrane-anchored protein
MWLGLNECLYREFIINSYTHTMLNKVPEIVLAFWIIKMMSTTVGETFADFLSATMSFGLQNTTVVLSSILLVALFFQIRAHRYIPALYWLTIALISTVGTLITDSLLDIFSVSLITTSVLFATALTITFVAWYVVEKTLSVHTITTTRREVFYWFAILFTFALGTATGDLAAEWFALGYAFSATMFGGSILAVYGAYRNGLNSILAFWAAYILTRPFGASIGDLLSQSTSAGGFGFGTTSTSILFLVAIVSAVAYLTISKKDEIKN